jgi:hypothetical protein
MIIIYMLDLESVRFYIILSFFRSQIVSYSLLSCCRISSGPRPGKTWRGRVVPRAPPTLAVSVRASFRASYPHRLGQSGDDSNLQL